MIHFMDQRPQYSAAGGIRFNTPLPSHGNTNMGTDHFHIQNTQRSSVDNIPSPFGSTGAPSSAPTSLDSLNEKMDQLIEKEQNEPEPGKKTRAKKKTSKKEEPAVEGGLDAITIEGTVPPSEVVEIKSWTKRYKKAEINLLSSAKKNIVNFQTKPWTNVSKWLASD